MRPEVVSHADWGTNPKKRVAAVARLLADGRYRVEVPARVGRTGSLREQLGVTSAEPGTTLLGFDFPIGIPAAYAERAGIISFRSALAQFGTGDWESFYEVAETPSEITPHRPFFPYSCTRKGTCSRKDLTSRLGFSWDELYRRCERKTETRAAASPLFWTLGGKQVGKAAICGWRDFVRPLLGEGSHVGLWPFDGDLVDLLGSRSCVIAETYPAEFYRHLDVRFPGGKGGGKRSQIARATAGRQLLVEAERLRIQISDAASRAIKDGFGPGGDGEDDFDAMVGLIGMLKHLDEGTHLDAPSDPAIRSVEGWILGQGPAAG